MMGAKRNRVFIRSNSFLIFCIWLFASQAIPNADAVHPDKYSSSQEKYYIHIMSEAEQEKIIVQKCCSNEEVLDEDGNCVAIDFKPEQINVEEKIRQAIEDSATGASGSEDVGRFILKVGRPHCLNRMGQLSILSSSEDSSFTKGLQFVTRAIDGNKSGNNSTFLIIDSREFCIDWLSSLDTLAIQSCVPETCHSSSTKPDSDDDPSTTLDPYQDTLNAIQEGIYSSGSPICLRKCCPPSHAINITSFQCVQHDKTSWQLHPLKASKNSSRRDYDGDDDGDQASHTVPLPVTWLTGEPNCLTYDVYSDTYDSYYINSDGILITVQNGTVGETPPGEYCIDAVALVDDTSKPQISRQMAMVCFEDYEPTGEETGENAELLSWRLVFTILTGISCLFLIITCFIYGLLWKDLNLPGWLQFAYAFSLLLTFSLLTVAQLWTQQIRDVSKGLCTALGYGLHFSFLSCFFWLTSMNLDLWLSFRNTVLVRGFGKRRGKRRFLEFAAFSVGFPAAIIILLLAADNCSPDDTRSICSILPSSGIGKDSCVFDMGAKLKYFYGFVGLLLLINLVIFFCTLISLRNRERETRLAKRQSTCNCDYDRLQLFTRLFLIMGVIWIFEVIAWSCEYVYGAGKVYKIFILPDCLNASQGIAVFLMFVWKKQTWKQLKKKFKSVGMRGKRPLNRPNCTYTVSNGLNGTGINGNETSVKSSHLSESTKSSDSGQIPSTSTTISQFEFDH